jgi:hypothetical protein
MYKVKDIKTGLFRNRKGLWPRWDEVGTLFLTKGAAKCSVYYNAKPNQYEVIEYEVELTEKSKEIYPKEKNENSNYK